MSEFRRVQGFHGARHEFRRSAADGRTLAAYGACARPRSRQKGPTRSATVAGTRSAICGHHACRARQQDRRAAPRRPSSATIADLRRHRSAVISSRHPHDTRGFAQTRNCPGRLQPVQTLRRHPHDTRGFAQARNCPGRLQPVQTLRRHPTGVPPPVRAQIQYRANLAECLGFDSDLSETSGISNKSYGFEPCVR
jgi:hypothetical protein